MNQVKAWHRLKIGLLYLGIALVTIALFRQALGYGFCGYDDMEILGAQGLVARFRLKAMLLGFAADDYMPVTFLAYTFVHFWSGWNAWAFHVANLGLHLANTALVLALVLQLTEGELIASGFIAALFALHPLHVESVIWISDLKDLLCTFFYLGGILFYFAYLRAFARRALLFCFFAFVLACLAKAVAITFPLAMILCDWRARRKPDLFALLEKIPFVLVGAALLAVHWQVHGKMGHSIPSGTEWLAVPGQVARALAFYIGKTLAPLGLGIYYEKGVVSPSALDYALTVAAIGIAGILGRRSRSPSRVWMIGGFLFFLATIWPVLKLVSFGTDFLYADRYMYLPGLGLFLALAGMLRELPLIGMIASSGAALTGVFLLAWPQVGTWQSNESLWLHVLQNYPGSGSVYQYLGVEYFHQRRYDDALQAYRKALELNPELPPKLHDAIGLAFTEKGQLALAEAEHIMAARLDPRDAFAHYRLGKLFGQENRRAEMIAEYRRATELDPGSALYYSTLGEAFAEQGSWGDSERMLKNAIAIDPEDAGHHLHLGLIYSLDGQSLAAIGEYRLALKLDPSLAEAKAKLRDLEK